jgi:heat shock protein HtpX
MAILAPIVAVIIQMMISRSREYHADAGAARLNESPYPLIHALEKLEAAHEHMQQAGYRTRANPATAHMFIVNPLRGGGFNNLFRTHPTTEDRVRRLRAMA